MTAKAEFEKFALGQMAGFGLVTVKRMFGGAALFRDGIIFGMLIDDALYLKGDDQTRERYDDEGLLQFTYGHKSGKSVAMSYWRAPDRCLDDPDEMSQWCAIAFAAAMRGKKPIIAKKSGPKKATKSAKVKA